MAVISVAQMERTNMNRRFRSLYALVAAVIAAAIAVTGCSAGGTVHSGANHGAQQAKVSLKFQLKGSASGAPMTLRCEPVGGTQHGAASACSTLLNLKKNPFAPIPAGSNCPMLLRSNKKILVTGTWFGITVHRLVVDGGCDTALFDSLDKIIH
jgi:hypothetical protein